MSIDRIEWHLESITDAVSDEEHWERAGAHIGYFIEWAYKNGFAPNNPETQDVEEYKKVSNSEIDGIRFLIENCDTKFWEEDLNEQGQKFTVYAYDTYLHNIATILGHEPFINMYNQQDLQSVFKYLDKVYSDYLANLSAQQRSEKNLFFKKIKNLFS